MFVFIAEQLRVCVCVCVCVRVVSVGKFHSARGLGERCKLLQRVRAEPGRQAIFQYLVHFGPRKAVGD